MAASTYLVVSADPDGRNKSHQFFSDIFIACDHAKRLTKDLNKDTFITEIKQKYYADRDKWNASKKPPKLHHPLELDI